MDDDDRAEEDGRPPGAAPGGEAVSWIEAALQAGLGGDGAARPDLARQALRGLPPDAAGAGGDCPVEAWLEAVAVEFGALAPGGADPEAPVRAVAARMRGSRAESLGAHARIESEKIGDLVRRRP